MATVAPGMALKHRAYEEIRRRIVSCRLMPGQVLSEQALAEELGMSRTPIREALVQLAQESLVRLAPRRGAFVAEISAQDIIEIFELREALETWVIRKVAGRIPQEKLQEFEAIFRQSNLAFMAENERFAGVDDNFHTYLVNLAGNRRCQALFLNLQDQNQRIRILSTLQPGRLEATFAEHLSIVMALRQGDAEQAVAAMTAHLRNARLVAMHLL
ncbi:MAG TPA: GntR family transcriptional regulator [Firmicutes bacterium]|nr:GntR family transcriptional regulator [Bacillota bacterium]